MLADDLAQIEMKKGRGSMKNSWQENITRSMGKLEKKTE